MFCRGSAPASIYRKSKLKSAYEDPLPLVPMDKELMGEVLGYLVDNAWKPSRDRGRLTISARRSSSGIQMEVSDTGPAPPEEVRRTSFEPFFTTKERGTGLGLAIARRVIESHGGT
jgi:signal transduction histidine kinase